MGQYDFTYEIPDNFHNRFVRFLHQNGEGVIAQVLQTCRLDYDDVGLAYYAGLRGDNWNKHAMDFTIEVAKAKGTTLEGKTPKVSETKHIGFPCAQDRLSCC